MPVLSLYLTILTDNQTIGDSETVSLSFCLTLRVDNQVVLDLEAVCPPFLPDHPFRQPDHHRLGSGYGMMVCSRIKIQLRDRYSV
jgi:hypothetical protein